MRDQPTSLKLLEQFLPQCAASITACTHLMQGNNIFAVEKPLMQYLPVLEAVAKRPSLYQQAAAALAQRDLEKFRHYFLEGVHGAQALNSQKRKQEAVENWKAAKKVWGSEPQILELAEELMDH